MDRRVLQLLARSIPEIAVVIIGSLGRGERLISPRLGHSVGNVEMIEATITLGGLVSTNSMAMESVLEERNKGMNGMYSPVIPRNRRDRRFAKKGSLMA